jgi:hypothetical protein
MSEVSYPERVLLLGPSLYWRLGTEGARDLSGNGNHGTADGGLVLGGADGSISDDTDDAAAFDGIDDQITSSYAPFTGTQALTVCGKALRTAENSIDVIWAGDGFAEAGGGDPSPVFEVTGSADGGRPRWYWTVEDFPAYQDWDYSWPLDEWVFYALGLDPSVVPGDAMDLYIDGWSLGPPTINPVEADPWVTPWSEGAGNFRVGQRGAGEGESHWWPGQMDEIAVFERKLTRDEVRFLAAGSG